MTNATPYFAAAIVGAVISVTIGYFAHASAYDGISFPFWIERPLRYGVVWWAIAGAAIGPAARYAFR